MPHRSKYTLNVRDKATGDVGQWDVEVTGTREDAVKQVNASPPSRACPQGVEVVEDAAKKKKES